MAENRIAYGLAKKHGIDTKGMSPKEVWDALKKKGITRESVDSGIRKQEKSKRKELEKKYNDDLRSNTINLPDEILPRSIGARWANHDIKMPDGTIAKFVEGSKITHKEVFAGYGTKKEIREVDRLVKDYPGTKAELWQKVKGKAEILWKHEQLKVEIHWYEEPSVGKKEIKYKREL